MVLYLVYREPLWDRYYSTIFSKATLFQIIIYILLILPPFFIAYSTNEFWQYTSSYREQPEVDFLDDLIVQISGEGCITTWSTFLNFNNLLEIEEIGTPFIQSQEVDRNQDGKNDFIYLNVSFTDLNCSIQTVKAVAVFNIQFTRFARVTVRSLIYLSESWAAPASKLWVGGALGMTQEVPFPASGQLTTYNSSLFDETGVMAEDFELRNILSAYTERKVRTHLSMPMAVWENANAPENFTLELKLSYPVFDVVYIPGFWQVVKFAWIQYLAIFWVFWFLLSKVQSFVYHNQVVLTLSGKKFHKQY